MNNVERHALSTLNFNLVPVPDDVWRESKTHVPELHKPVVDSIFDGVSMARHNPSGSPLGVVVQGPAGSGKTHMLGMVRQRTQQDETGYFFLVSLFSGTDFWQTVAFALSQGLRRPAVGWPTQLIAFLRRVTTELGMASADRDAICGDVALTREVLDRFVHTLRSYDNTLGREVQYTARALVLMASKDFAHQDIADGYLGSLDGADWPDWTTWGLPTSPRPARLAVQDVSRLLALTGPTVIAFDQLDMLFAQAIGSWVESGSQLPSAEKIMLAQIAEGLVGLREVVQRTLIILACIPATWELLRGQTAGPFVDRFRESAAIGRISDASVGKAIVAKHLQAHWSKINFTPPYDVWPMALNALDSAGQYTARTLLRLVHKQVRRCLTDNVTPGKATLGEMETWPDDISSREQKDDPTIDRLFDQLVASALVADALDHTKEDVSLPPLLDAGLRAWIIEQGHGNYKVDPPPGSAPALHARLREVLDEQTEDERHWAIRGIAATHHSAVRSRIGKASLAAGHVSSDGKRRLVLLRNASWDLGPKTNQLVAQFRNDGGLTLTVDDRDLKVFAALRKLLEDEPPGLAEWLAASRPASSTRLMREMLAERGHERPPADAIEPAPELPPVTPRERPMPQWHRPREEPARAAESFPFGFRFDDRTTVEIPLESLRKHTVIFAGSGSGKTVLIRRLIEECALAGVSSIVLDPNNDLARLGDGWPVSPAAWGDGDAQKAELYLARLRL